MRGILSGRLGRLLLLSLTLLPLLTRAPLVHAADRPLLIQRDERGRVQERWEPGPANSYVRRDDRGRRLGTVEPTPYGDYVLRDNRGRRTGTIEQRR